MREFQISDPQCGGEFQFEKRLGLIICVADRSPIATLVSGFHGRFNFPQPKTCTMSAGSGKV